MKNIFLMILMFVVVPSMAYSAEIPRDPFESLLPRQQEGAKSDENLGTITMPPVTIQGILWGSEKPAAIIDGEVYNIGDTLKSVDGQLCKIEKNSVFINYKGKVFEVGSPKKKEGR